jgi:hypothetical protein
VTRRRKTLRRVRAPNWEVAFFRAGTSAPGIGWLRSLTPEVRREFLKRLAVLSLHKPGPYALQGTLWWRVMRGEMSGIWEIRDQHQGTNFRLFCVLDRKATAHGLSSPAIVVIGGASKPEGVEMAKVEYQRIREHRDAYLASDPRAIVLPTGLEHWFPPLP